MRYISKVLIVLGIIFPLNAQILTNRQRIRRTFEWSRFTGAHSHIVKPPTFNNPILENGDPLIQKVTQPNIRVYYPDIATRYRFKLSIPENPFPRYILNLTKIDGTNSYHLIIIEQ